MKFIFFVEFCKLHTELQIENALGPHYHGTPLLVTILLTLWLQLYCISFASFNWIQLHPVFRFCLPSICSPSSSCCLYLKLLSGSTQIFSPTLLHDCVCVYI